MRVSVATVVLAAVMVAPIGAAVVRVPRVDSSDDTNVTVEVPGLGSVLGNKHPTENEVKQVWHFLGIPYVEKPDRFMPPEKYKEFGDYDATFRRSMCPQASFYPWDLQGENMERLRRDSEVVGESEDCLTLDIYTPQIPGVDGAPDEPNLPVFFFIHGGAFVVGSSKSAQPDFILERENMVLVSIQYRLGPLGFLAINGGEGKNVSNAGLHDQMWALKWTYEHIKHFGGNPDDIVIGGVSAGGATSGLLYVSPKTRQWVKGALLFSGCSVVPWTIDQNPESSLNGHAQRVGCNGTTGEEMLTCMQQVDHVALLNATFAWAISEKSQGRLGMGGTIPVVDGDLLPTMPEDILKDEDFPGRPLVIGVTKHEGNFVYIQLDTFYIMRNELQTDPYTLKHEFGDILLRFAGIHDTQHILGDAVQRQYFREDQLGNYTAMWAGTIDYTGAAFFKAPAWHMAKLNSDRHGKSFLYTFNYISQEGRHDPVPIANHGSDQIYLFPARNESFVYRNEDMHMVEQFSAMVANFVVHKDPRRPGTEEFHGARWLPATREDDYYLVIDDEWEGKKGFTNEYFVVNAVPDDGDGGDGSGGNGGGNGNGNGNSLRSSGAWLLAILALIQRL